jgi:uncharacterized phage-associated protein
MPTPYDSRAVANLMLEEAQRLGHTMSHLALQKLLYFAHGLYLVERKRPLMTGYFEAWRNGPVHPAVYKAFKQAGSGAITFPAYQQNLATGELTVVPPPDDPEVRKHIARIITQFGDLPADLLVSISHARDGPWHFVVDKSRTGIVFGLRLTDNVISARFKHHKVSVGATSFNGDPGEDTPLT